MSFLAPLFLAAAAMIAGPLIAHMVRRTTKQSVSFSAMRFLAPSAPRFERRSRIEHPWLLALRCLIVLLLAAAFARPLLQSELPAFASASAPRRVVLVLDESASMRRAGLWAAAQARTRQIVEELSPDDGFVLLAAAGKTTELIAAETWAKTARPARAGLLASVIDARAPGWGPTYLDSAMETGLERLEELAEKLPGARGTLVVVSDFAAGARIAGLAGREWPKGDDVRLERIQAPDTPNAGVQWLGWSADPARGAHARVKVSRDNAAGAGAFRVQLVDAVGGKNLGTAQNVPLAAGESRAVSLPVPAGFDGPVRVDLSGDRTEFDNQVWAVKPEPRRVEIAYLGRHAEGDPEHARFYLERAAGGRDPVVTLRAVVPDDVAAVTALSPGVFFVVAEPLSPPVLAVVRARLEQGAFALVLLASREMVATAAAMFGETGWRPAESARKDALLGKIDFAHPLFAPFSDPRFSDFTRVHFWKTQSVSLPAGTAVRVVANFDDGPPAVLEGAVGRGVAVVWGGDWARASGQWVLSTKFVPWLQALFERASGGPRRPASAVVGDAARLTKGGAQWRRLTEREFSAGEPEEPGVFKVRDTGGERWVALQLSAEESRTDALPADAFERLGVPTKAVVVDRVAEEKKLREESRAQTEARQKLWRWLMVSAAVLLAFESVAAWRVARREPAMEGAV